MSHGFDYTELTAALQAWMEDDDSEFIGSIPDVIQLGEVRLLRDLDLTIFNTTDTTPTVQSQEWVVKPTGLDVFNWQSVWYLNGLSETVFLELRSFDFVQDLRITGTESAPLFYAEETDLRWALAPIPDAIYTLNARGLTRPATLSVGNPNTWLGDNAGDLLFKACLAESESFLKSDDRQPIWEADYQKLLPSAKRELYELMATRYPEPRAFPLGS